MYVHNNCHKNHTEGYMMIRGEAKLSQNYDSQRGDTAS